PYELLGVSRDASVREIGRAWRQQARVHHPDKAAEEDKATAEASFKRVAEAHELLADPDRRRQYDLYGIQDSHSSPGERGRHHQPHWEAGWEDEGDDFGGISEEELQELIRQLFGNQGARQQVVEPRTSEDVWEGMMGIVIFGGLAAGFAWLSRRPLVLHFSNWAWWQWRFMMHDLGLG
ncbi:unnamed protein product, partial [Polarella glacialis]